MLYCYQKKIALLRNVFSESDWREGLLIVVIETGDCLRCPEEWIFVLKNSLIDSSVQ